MLICTSRSIEKLIGQLLDSMELNERFEKAHQSFGERNRRGKVIPRVESYQIPGLEVALAYIDVHGPYNGVPDFLVLSPKELTEMMSPGNWHPQRHLSVLPTGVYTTTFVSRPQDRSSFEQMASGKLIMTNEQAVYISNADDKIREIALELQLEKFLKKPVALYGNNKIIYNTDKCLEEIRESLYKLGVKRTEFSIKG